MSNRRLSYAEREILDLIRQSPEQPLSYTTLAAHAFVDPRTAIAIVRRLEQQQRIEKHTGRGRNANMYSYLS